jgi:hypothetical protein
MKCFRTHVGMDFVFVLGAFKLHPVYLAKYFSEINIFRTKAVEKNKHRLDDHYFSSYISQFWRQLNKMDDSSTFADTQSSRETVSSVAMYIGTYAVP